MRPLSHHLETLVSQLHTRADPSLLDLAARMLDGHMSTPFQLTASLKYFSKHHSTEKGHQLQVLINKFMAQDASMVHKQEMLAFLFALMDAQVYVRVKSPEKKPVKAKKQVDVGTEPSIVYHPQNAAQENEQEWIQNVLFVCQGIDAPLVQFPSKKNVEIVHGKSISVAKANLVQELVKLGWLYKSIQGLLTKNKGLSLGLLQQSFLSVVEQELNEYQRLLAVFESHEANLSLCKMVLWTMEPLHKLQTLHALLETSRGQKGGQLIGMLHEYASHGDPAVAELMSHMLNTVTQPFFEMIYSWTTNGSLDDPFGEFFVKVDSTAENDILWKSKYIFSYDMVPSFFSKPLAKKIYLIGKSLNFVHLCCGDTEYVKGFTYDRSLLNYKQLDSLEHVIEDLYSRVSSHLLHLMTSSFHYKQHLFALKQFLLLGAGDFCSALLSELEPVLSRPAKTLYRHTLTAGLETAIRSSIAQFESAEILKRLDVSILQTQEGELGWDVFTLDYHVSPPLNSILSPAIMTSYKKLFYLLFRIKQMDYWLSRNPASLSKRYFVRQIQYYTSQLLEAAWYEFDQKECVDLDDVIHQHTAYLNGLISRFNSSLHGILDVLRDVKRDEDAFRVKVKEFLSRDTQLALFIDFNGYYGVC